MGYLMSPYAAAYANGLTNGSHMVRYHLSLYQSFIIRICSSNYYDVSKADDIRFINFKAQ